MMEALKGFHTRLSQKNVIVLLIYIETMDACLLRKSNESRLYITVQTELLILQKFIEQRELRKQTGDELFQETGG